MWQYVMIDSLLAILIEKFTVWIYMEESGGWYHLSKLKNKVSSINFKAISKLDLFPQRKRKCI